MFLVYLVELYTPVRGLSRLTTTAFTAAAGAERVIELLDEQPLVTDRAGARALLAPRGAVEFDRVPFRYPAADRDSLHEISFRCEPGEVVALSAPAAGASRRSPSCSRASTTRAAAS